MKRVKAAFAPPLEADSLYLKITSGCSYNQCSFCGTYRDTPFQVRTFEEIAAEVEKVCRRYQDEVFRVFLGEGDALVTDTALLLRLLRLFHEKLPRLQQVGIYANPQALLGKTPQALAELNQAGLQGICMGVESGSDKILQRLNKGVTVEQVLQAGRRAVEAGFKLTTLAILGAGGRQDWRENAASTGRILSQIDPQTILMLTLVLMPDTPLFESARIGQYTPPTPVESVLELKELIASIDVTKAVFKSSHSSNFLRVSGVLPQDKDRMLHQLERVLNNPTEEFFDPGYFKGT